MTNPREEIHKHVRECLKVELALPYSTIIHLCNIIIPYLSNHPGSLSHPGLLTGQIKAALEDSLELPKGCLMMEM